MKKILAILAITGALSACNNSTEEKADKKEDTEIKSGDTSRMQHEPSNMMEPGDTTGRRPRD